MADMIGFVTLGTNDLEKAKGFYGKVLALLGASPVPSRDGVQRFGNREGPMLGIYPPYDGQPATGGNGTMVAFRAPSRAIVDAVYKIARDSGAADEGAPGERDPTFYGAYFRDPDGNKLCVFCNPQQEES